MKLLAGAVLCLAVAVFGVGRLVLLAIYPACAAIGGLAAVWIIATKRGAGTALLQSQFLPSQLPALVAGLADTTRASKREHRYDTRFTGSPKIDEELNEIVDLAIRDYISYWCVLA